MNADLLVLLSDVDGLYTGPPSDPSSRLIQTYYPEHANNEVKFGGKSRVGRGGMESKVCYYCSCYDVRSTHFRRSLAWRLFQMLTLLYLDTMIMWKCLFNVPL